MKAVRITVDAEVAELEAAHWRSQGYEVEVEDGRVFNLDTDSAMTNVELPCSTELGDMKDEFPGERLKGTFIQPKCYILEKDVPFAKEHLLTCADQKCKGCSRHKIAMKGLPKKQRTYANIQALLRGETVEFERLEKVRSMAAFEFRRPPKMVAVKKRIVGGYDKRVIQADGATTKPLVFALPDEMKSAAE